MDLFMRSVLSLIIAVAVAAPVARAQDDASCAFDYVIEGGLIAEAYSEVTPALQKRPEFAENARRALPNVKRIFVEQGGYSALVGWERLPEDYSKFSELQVQQRFRYGVEYGKRAIYPEAETSYRFAETPPFSVFLTLEYFAKGNPFRDLSMDVVATSWCLLSVKFSGRVVQGDAQVWDRFAEELERIRAVVAAEEEPVIFSEEGARFSLVGVLGTAIYIGIAVAIALLAFFVLRWRFHVEPGKAAWRYSAIIAIVAACTIGLIVFVNETLRGVPTLPYESVLVLLVVLAVHLAVLIMRTALLILAAISLMIGTFATRWVYVATDWMAFPDVPELIGISVGLLLLTYVVWGTLRRKIEAQP